jgi:transposase
MIAFPAGTKVWIAGGVTDMRRGMNTLALAVQQGLGRDPHGGEIFCFRGRKGDLVKLLWHDGTGHVALHKAAGGWEVHLAGEPGWNRRFDIGGAAGLSARR